MLMVLYAVGIDLHHKVELIKETNSNAAVRLGTKRSSLLPPAEVFPHKATTKGSTKPAKAQSNLSKVNKETDDMPSFKLIDDELEEGILNNTHEMSYLPVFSVKWDNDICLEVCSLRFSWR